MAGLTGSSPVDATGWAVADVEPSGDDPKEWLIDPSDSSRWLFKPATVKDGRRQGEDWAELLANRVAGLLAVPAAEIRLAERDGHPGCLSRDARPAVTVGDGHEFLPAQPGSVLLSEVIADYRPRSRDRRGHTLDNVRRVLTGVTPPGATDGADLSAFDVFAGYLVLDALIAGQDRHSDNWSVAFHQDGQGELLPSYDHASSLGFNLLDERRSRLLGDPVAFQRWARNGCATRFEDGREVSLVDHAAAALALSPLAHVHWEQRLTAFDVQAWRAVAVPEGVVSEVGRTFAVEVVNTNRRRLLDVIRTRSGQAPS